MPIPVEVLEAKVSSLPASERSRLLDRLPARLGPNPEWEEAWAPEIDRREAEIAGGRAQWRPGEKVLAHVRATLANRAAARAYDESETYTHARTVREGAGVINMAVVDGVN